MITAHGSEKIAVEAMKLGADDYVPKPFDNDELRVVVARSLSIATDSNARIALLREQTPARVRLRSTSIGFGPSA